MKYSTETVYEQNLPKLKSLKAKFWGSNRCICLFFHVESTWKTTQISTQEQKANFKLVGRAVASDTIGPRLESSHRQILFCLYSVNCIEKTKRGRKRPLKNIFESVTG